MASYDYWRNALAGTFGPVHDSDPQPGFWRRRTSKAGGFEPVAIFEHNGAMVATVGARQVDAADLWTFVCRYPVPEEWYRAKIAGEPWPDEDGAVTASLAGPGHNAPPQDESEILDGQIDAAMANAAGYEEIKDDETAAKAQSARARLNELSREADKKREALKKPHFEAGKAIDLLWNPLVKKAKGAADKIAAALGAHETRKAREAERAAAAAAAAAKAAAEKAAETGAPPPPAPAPPPPQVPQTTVRGAYGRAAAVKAVKVATVVDQDALYAFCRTHPELVSLLAKLAQRAVDAGLSPPGVTVEEQRKVV